MSFSYFLRSVLDYLRKFHFLGFFFWNPLKNTLVGAEANHNLNSQVNSITVGCWELNTLLTH